MEVKIIELWVVFDSLSNEPEPFKTKEEAVSFALEILQDYQERWQFEQEEYEDSCAMIKNGDDNSEYWGSYLGECEVKIFKKFI